MNEDQISYRSEAIDFSELQTSFLSLRIGEEIPQLQIKEIRKVTNATRDDNLPGVDYKYVIKSTDNKILTVNSWVLWKCISTALQEAGSIYSTLYLRHEDREIYTVRVI